MKKIRIPSVLALVASLALLGCGDLGTGPSAEAAPQFTPGSGQGNAFGHATSSGHHEGEGLARNHSHGTGCPPSCN